MRSAQVLYNGKLAGILSKHADTYRFVYEKNYLATPGRQQLIVFHDELQILEALFVFCSRNTDDNAIKKKIAVTKFRLLKQDQLLTLWL